MPETQAIRMKYNAALDRIRTLHIKRFPGYDAPLFLISNAYPGVWLEHAYDALSWAAFSPEDRDVARGQVCLFLDHQKEDGQLPCFVLDQSNPNTKSYGKPVGYGQIQECVSFTTLCLEAAELLGDEALLERAYAQCCGWDGWLVRNRMTMGTGLIELFCQFDTGHDNSARLEGIPGGCPEGDAKRMNDTPALPLLAPDMNAVFYGSRMSLARMARLLGRGREAAQWEERALRVKQALFAHCYDAQDDFFYDADCRGNLRRHRSIAISNLFGEHVLSQEEGSRIYQRHMKNPQSFWTPYPFPSMAIDDPGSKQDRPGNSWGFYSQGLTTLRAFRWMDFYGKQSDFDELLRRWVSAVTASEEMQFSQELHPITGEMSQSSQWYSSTMLVYLHAVRRLGLLG